MGGVGGGKVVFSNLPADVWLLAKEGELEVATLAADASQGDMAGVTVASGATLTLDAGVDLRTMPLDVRGVVGEESTTYGGDFGTSLDGLDGDGTVKVLSRTVTWTGAGADAKISTPANWQGGEAPLLRSGTQNAVFPADALRTDVTVDSDAYFDGGTLGGVSYSFTGPDSVFGVGTNGLSVAEPADAGGATYDFSVKIAQSGHGAWRMPTASTASKIYFRRPLVDGAAAGRIYTSGSKFYFHTTNSTYTGDVFVTNAVVNAVYAYGPAPFGTNGTLRVRSCSTSTAVLSLKDVQIHNNVQLDVAYDGRRRTLDFSGATNEFYGTFRNIVGASDNNYHKGVVIFHKGYGSSDKIGYVNWNGNIGSGEVHLMDKFYASTMEHGGINVHFHCASNYFSNLGHRHGRGGGRHALLHERGFVDLGHERGGERLGRP